MSNRPIDDTSKPSRLNRRRKKKWKITTLALTAWAFETILSLPFKKRTAWIITPELGQKMAATLCGFFSSVIQSGISPFLFCYGGLHGAAFERAAPSCGGDNPMQSATRNLSPSLGGLSTITRITAMNTHFTGPNCAKKPTPAPLFSIFFHRKCFAMGINGRVAMRLKSRNPAFTVKFSGWEV